MGSQQSTPTHGFESNLALDCMLSIDRDWCMSGPPGQAQQYVLLVTSGAFDPMHIKHVEAMQAAVAAVSKLPLTKVIGARVVVSGDAYVTSKLRRAQNCVATPQEHRFNIARIAIASACSDDDNIICASNYEMQFSSFVDYPQVCQAAKKELVTAARNHQNKWIRDNADKLAIYYVCGHDHAVKCSLDEAQNREGWCDGLVVMGRCANDAPAIGFYCDAHDIFRRSVVHVPSTDPEDVSSTVIRRAMLENDLNNVRRLLHPAVVAYIEEHNLQTKRIAEQ